ncbi:sulfatase-like hydrolase/transferase [candidate division KSB1 bacterium]|nr:sulfatase-like hydrolase/transferase [candidate division KSB1 bacterium]
MKPKNAKPNILVLMSDQHSKHTLGCYGNRLVRTPNLDRLARHGMRFTNAYCPAPLCVPSRMSFMTSRTPSHNRVWNNQHSLSSGIPTWAHVLGAAGYETALIGRMHFVGSDHRHGFELRPIGEYSAKHPGSPEIGGPRWTKFPAATSGQNRKSVEIAGTGTTTYQWFDEQVAEAACRYLREKQASSRERPFAAVAGFVLPHCPFIAPKRLFDYYYPRIDIPEIEIKQPATIERFRRIRGILSPPLLEERIRIARAAYFGLCEYFDSLIGQVLDCLDETGFSENTLVVYCSDHGEMAGEHGCWWKSNYYEGSVGVPLIARLPGVIPEGATSDAVCNLMDLGPTFADASEADYPVATDGRSLWQLLRNNQPDGWINETFSELVDCCGNQILPSRMIRSGKWKLWCFADDANLPPALFNLEDDLGEQNDLGEDAAYAEVREYLLEKNFRNWDGELAARETRRANDDLKLIAAWGNRIKPSNPDALAVPPPEIENDVELL